MVNSCIYKYILVFDIMYQYQNHSFHKNVTLFTKAPLFSQKYHSFHKPYLEKARKCPNILERYRSVCVPYVSMVPKNYDYRRLEATITRSASRSCHIFLKIYHFFLKLLCFGRQLTYPTWEVPEFSQNNDFFSK